MTFFSKNRGRGNHEKAALVKAGGSPVCSVPDTGHRSPPIDPACAQALARPPSMDHVGSGRCLGGKRYSYVPLHLEGLRLHRI